MSLGAGLDYTDSNLTNFLVPDQCHVQDQGMVRTGENCVGPASRRIWSCLAFSVT